MNIESYIDDLKIIFYGKAHLKLDQILKIKLPAPDPGEIEMVFKNDSKTNSNVTWQIEEKLLKINFFNYVTDPGGGVLQPWKIGSYNGREFYITVYVTRVSDFKNEFAVVDYIFYSGKEVANE
ncbi:DUF6864 domain-containing function [Flavobacterium ustbae]|uniref:DUF6864 domain-containing function n=1 Tax=Flavobacterium ustbae TaxID=2488790 RepID=UPI000F78D231|nr:hypothetical protein [Flavobacterium ustbae]